MWGNVVCASSNLMALRVISHLYDTGRIWSFYVFVGSMVSSILFHLIETDEVSVSSPVDRAILSGIFNEKVEYGAILLLFDRIFAILAAVSTLLYTRETNQLRLSFGSIKETAPILNWSKVIMYSLIALAVTIYSELCQSEWLYVVSHSIWHILAFHIAYSVFNPIDSSLYE